MPSAPTDLSTQGRVNTVLGPVPAGDLGVTAVHEALLSVYPGAQFAPDVRIDRAEVFEVLAARLSAFREAGGGTVVDSTGMFHGRDLSLLEAVSRSTGVHVVASTGMGPEEMLGGYFLTPQTNPPTPWPAEKFADLFSLEVIDGMVVPRLERRAAAGLVTTTVTREAMTPTDESLLRGAARTALATGVPLSFRFGADVVAELDVVLQEGIDPSRVLVGDLDRADVGSEIVAQVAEHGVRVGLDHVGSTDDEHLDDDARAVRVRQLLEAGHAERLLLSCNAIAVGRGVAATDVTTAHLLTDFVPRLRELGADQAVLDQLLVDNPRALLTVGGH